MPGSLPKTNALSGISDAGLSPFTSFIFRKINKGFRKALLWVRSVFGF
jgi:hypothetical protein